MRHYNCLWILRVKTSAKLDNISAAFHVKRCSRRKATPNRLFCLTLMAMTHPPQICAKNPYQKAGTIHRYENRPCPIRYQKLIGPYQKHLYQIACQTRQTGTGFLVQVFCADFWLVCHGHNVCLIELWRHTFACCDVARLAAGLCVHVGYNNANCDVSQVGRVVPDADLERLSGQKSQDQDCNTNRQASEHETRRVCIATWFYSRLPNLPKAACTEVLMA